MRGIFSFILVSVLISSVLLLYSIFHILSISASETSLELLVLENHYARQMEIKRAITNSIIHGAKEESLHMSISDEITESAGNKLAELENLENNYRNINRLAVNFWCGTTNEQEISEMLEQMHSLNRTIACRNCKDMDEPVIRNEINLNGEYKLNPVYYCTSFLVANSILRTIAVGPPDPRITPSILSMDQPVIGASLYDSRNRIASVITVPIFTVLNYG